MFRDKLAQEFATRRATNPRYSLRAFAAFLRVDHSSLGQILRGSRRAPPADIRRWSRKLGMTPEEAAVYVAAQHVPEHDSVSREHHLRHWTAEALAVISGPAHWEIARRAGTSRTAPASRAIASACGLSVDEVNVALARLLRLGLLDAGAASLTQRQFLKLALERVREKSKE